MRFKKKYNLLLALAVAQRVWQAIIKSSNIIDRHLIRKDASFKRGVLKIF
jgi:hypothetical protein